MIRTPAVGPDAASPRLAVSLVGASDPQLPSGAQLSSGGSTPSGVRGGRYNPTERDSPPAGSVQQRSGRACGIGSG
ncbi:MAG: hypothetical protein ACYCVN_01275 [Acidimicrobiales bacterium]